MKLICSALRQRTGWLLLFFLAGFSRANAQPVPRLVVLTDIGGDPDDQQSLVRLLVHADQFSIEGLLATSRLEHGQDTRPELIHEQLDAYAAVYENLRQHSPGFPIPDSLRAVVRAGLGNQTLLGEGHDSSASDWLIRVVDKPDDRPVWVSIWGGQRELAQALWRVKNTRSAEAARAFVSKLRVYAIGNQDSRERWIVDNFPELFFISSGFTQYGYPVSPKVREYSAYRGVYMTGDESLTSRAWVQTNVRQRHGPLGLLYPADGAGQPGMKEGDSPAFLGLLTNGLNQSEHPDYGGFGGRYRKLRGNFYTDIPDYLAGVWNERLSVSRWRSYFQNEFAARMDWCVKPYNQANHAPNAVLNGSSGPAVVNLIAQPGQEIILSATGSTDPDGNALNYYWQNYWEAGSYPGKISIANPDKITCRMHIPEDATAGTVLHVILAVSDSGAPSLTRFKRVAIRVRP